MQKDLEIVKVLQKGRETFVLWSDGTYTSVKRHPKQIDEGREALLYAVAKKALGDDFLSKLREHTPDKEPFVEKLDLRPMFKAIANFSYGFPPAPSPTASAIERELLRTCAETEAKLR